MLCFLTVENSVLLAEQCYFAIKGDSFLAKGKIPLGLYPQPLLPVTSYQSLPVPLKKRHLVPFWVSRQFGSFHLPPNYKYMS